MGPAEVTIEPLVSMLRAAEEAHLLKFALDKNIFDLVDRGQTAAGLAETLGYDYRRTVALLDALTAMGFLIKDQTGKDAGNNPELRRQATGEVKREDEGCSVWQQAKSEDVYCLSMLSFHYLRESSPYFSRDLLMRRFSRLMSTEELEEKLSRVSEERSTESAAAQQAKKNPGEFTRVMVQNALGSGSIRRLAKLVASHPSFFGARRILDLGGGHGLYTAALCRLNRRLEGVVFDLPEITGVTSEYIKEQGLQDRITTREGNFYHDSLGEGYQVVMAVNALHRPPEILRRVLDKIYASMDPGGVLYLQHRYLNVKRTAPRESVMFYFNRALEVDAFYLPSLKEAVNCGIEAGFSLSGIFRFRGGDTCIRLEKSSIN